MLISLLLSLVIFLFSGINFLRLIQIKDYFFPSLWAHFDYPSSYHIFFRKREILLIFIWLVILLSETNLLISNNYLFLILIILGSLFYLRKEQLKIIKWNLKSIFILCLITLINTRILSLSYNNLLVLIILLTSTIQFSITIFSLYFANLLTKIYTKYLFKKTKEKIKLWLEKSKDRLVIGITGSYGKTSTKEIISQLLETKFKVLKSPLRLNAEIGLSKFILDSDLENYQILILELGARQVGEIEQMVDIFHPKCAFLTGLAPQHLATFGSFENIIKGKLEIFKKVIPDGLAFLNGNDVFVRKVFNDLQISNKYLYSHPEGNFYFKDEIFNLDYTEFTFVYQDGEIRLKTNLIGNQFLENLAGALGLCYLLGIKPEELKEKLLNLKLLPNQFEVIKKTNPLIINDSYNANIVGIKKEIDFFNKIFSGKKILFFAGILELGIETEDIYKEILDYFKNFDLVILTFKDYTEIFINELKEKIIIYDNQKIEDFIKKFNLEELGILILGRIPEKLLNDIKKL